MSIDEQTIKELLVSEHYVSAADLSKAQEVATASGVSLLDALQQEGFVTKQLIGQAMSEKVGFPYADVSKEKIDEQIFFSIPELVAVNQNVVALRRLQSGIKIAMVDPSDIETRELIEKRLGEPVIPYFTLETDIEGVMGRYKQDLRNAFEALIHRVSGKADDDGHDEAIIHIVDMLLQYAHDNRTSDIHIEPYRKKIMVRFRIDGVMHDVLDIPKELRDAILSRIKILSHMRTDEHRAAQDGKMRFTTPDDEVVDVRVSIVPTNVAENVVMRLLSSKSRNFDLKSIGFGEEDLTRVRDAIKHPHGMILVTGPTGSGKTTSLYAVLKILNQRDVHIATIEDPVEYDVEGISQIQVNTKTNLTFAKGLRALVRQDPDIIMVGEIRDEETAGIAVNSALTGHLVLSTLHTNDAPTTLPRLLDMGVEPFLVASTVNIIIAQRLVRKLCHGCRVSYTPDKKEQTLIEKDPHLFAYAKKYGNKKIDKLRLYKGAGCKVCGDTGYEGRVGIFEILEMTDTIRELVMANTSADAIREKALADGMTSMMEDGVRKVLEGTTTLAEVLRVARD